MVHKKEKKFISLEEFTKRETPCKNWRNCTDKDCPYLHNLKTRMCKFEGNCRKKNCTFAHSLDELYVPLCRYGEKCKNKEKCTFKHPKIILPPPSPVQKQQSEEQLTPENFPTTVSLVNTEELEKDILDYTEIRQIIRHVDFITLKGLHEEMIEQYKNIQDFKVINFKLS